VDIERRDWHACAVREVHPPSVAPWQQPYIHDLCVSKHPVTVRQGTHTLPFPLPCWAGGSQVADLGSFDADRTITLVPPEGEFALINYRCGAAAFKPPFRLQVRKAGMMRCGLAGCRC
jgi:hypothetical protein